MVRAWLCFVFVTALHGIPNASGEELWTETNMLSRALAKRYGVSEAQAQREVERVFATLREELLHGRRVVALGFGTFAVEQRRARRKRGASALEPGKKLGSAKKYLRFRAADSVAVELNR